MTKSLVRHVPNLLSALRLLAAPFAAWLIWAQHDIAAFCVFAGASASDAVDGFVARRWGVASRFGAWLDPVADKLLMLLCFTALYNVKVAPGWLLALVVGRDAAIAAVWLLMRRLAQPLRVRPLKIGKLSTAAQAGYVLLALLLLAFDLDAPRLLGLAAAITGLLTAGSGAAYGWLFLRDIATKRGAAP
jgi:cardiolipin synthase